MRGNLCRVNGRVFSDGRHGARCDDNTEQIASSDRPRTTSCGSAHERRCWCGRLSLGNLAGALQGLFSALPAAPWPRPRNDRRPLPRGRRRPTLLRHPTSEWSSQGRLTSSTRATTSSFTPPLRMGSTSRSGCVPFSPRCAGGVETMRPGSSPLTPHQHLSPTPPRVQISDDAMCAAKAAKTGQTLQPFSHRRGNVASWCDSQSVEDVASFTRSYGDVIGPLTPPVPRPSTSAPPSPSTTAPSTAPSSSSPSSSSSLPASPRHPYRGRYSLHELHDPFGPSITDPSYTGIACSEETKEGCRLINDKRREAGMRPLELFVAPLLCGPTGAKLSSTDLRAARARSGSSGGAGSGSGTGSGTA